MKTKKSDEKFVTEDTFLSHMMAEGSRCTDAIRMAKMSLFLNVINMILVIVAIIVSNVL